jgi:nicotinamide mononucleotide (NMN) deamidase PncC
LHTVGLASLVPPYRWNFPLPAPWSESLIRQIHDAPGQFVLCVTGGGSQSISALLEVPGASRTVLEAAVPYAAEALVAWLKARPEQFCSESTARQMAMAAYNRALSYVGHDSNATVAGVACTASLASDRPKHGAHRIHAALQTATCTVSHSLELLKGHRSRAREEAIAAAMILNLIAEFKCLLSRIDLDLLPQEHPAVDRCDAPLDWQRLLSGGTKLVAGTAVTAQDWSTAAGRIVFPGAFHPRHEGHREMALVAGQRLGLPVEHELSMLNVDKPPIDFIEMRRRAEQFGPNELLWFSRAPSFVEKAVLFPRATFVVGADTIVRIADARYYGSEAARDAALATLAAAGCRFLVFGRCHDGPFQSLSNLRMPAALAQLCDEVPGELFRRDISSTELRSRA